MIQLSRMVQYHNNLFWANKIAIYCEGECESETVVPIRDTTLNDELLNDLGEFR